MLLDLGLAIRLPASETSSGSSPGVQAGSNGTTTKSELREGFGVRGYRAPEIQRQRPYGTPVDIFSYGRILYNLLSAVAKPPRARGLRVARAAIVERMSDEFGFLFKKTACWAYEVLFCEPKLSPRWPPELAELVVRCLEVEPSARPDAAAIHEALDACEHALRTED